MRLLRETYPGVPVVTYVNTSAEVKAESDVCVTSGNAVQIVESLGVPTRNLSSGRVSRRSTSRRKPTSKSSRGRATAKCTSASPATTSAAFAEDDPRLDRDRASRMSARRARRSRLHRLDARHDRVRRHAERGIAEPSSASRVLLMTECSMADNVAARYPNVEFVRPCNLCPHMKRNTLPKMLHSLEAMEYEVTDRAGGCRTRAPIGRAHARASACSRATSPSIDGRRHSDAIVVGAGIAGLMAALKLVPMRVTVLCKTRLGIGAATDWAQGGIAAAMGKDDSPTLHAIDTQRAGAGISDETIVEILTDDAPARIEELLELGAAFDRRRCRRTRARARSGAPAPPHRQGGRRRHRPRHSHAR